MTPVAPEEGDKGLHNTQRDENPDNRLDARIDRVLNKYVFVWIWSILFGTATGAAITFANTRPFGRFRIADFLIGALVASGGFFTLLSIYVLYRFLMRVLLPMFVSGESGELKREGFYLLSRSVKYLVTAFGIGLLVVLVQYVLGGLGD